MRSLASAALLADCGLLCSGQPCTFTLCFSLWGMGAYCSRQVSELAASEKLGLRTVCLTGLGWM